MPRKTLQATARRVKWLCSETLQLPDRPLTSDDIMVIGETVSKDIGRDTVLVTVLLHADEARIEKMDESARYIAEWLRTKYILNVRVFLHHGQVGYYHCDTARPL